MKTVTGPFFNTNIPNSLKELILRTTSLSPIGKLEENIAVAFKGYVQDVLISLYQNPDLTKKEALEALAQAMGLKKEDLIGRTEKQNERKDARHLKITGQFKDDFENAFQTMFGSKKK